MKPQRIRDPLHNLIEFDLTDQLERVLWRVIQTRPFQRLRRIKQLGFSEMVYPGATHTRFAHSIGVFHTARQLMKIIRGHIARRGGCPQDHQLQVALAAALVHDIGHGMFSHAFEEVGKTLNLKMAHHEDVSDAIIRSDELREAFRELGPGFADEVADVIKPGPPRNLYNAVVSSQFDADRLDYMRRDRLMTGVQNSGIDFDWLLANLEIAEVTTGVDAEPLLPVETFVLGPKATHAAETYVLALFQLYPTVYHHKTTRAAQKIFSTLMLRLFQLAGDRHGKNTGLPKTHPFIQFARNPNKLDQALALDDTVLWGALPLLTDADDPIIRDCATRLRDRKLPKCIDIRARLVAELGTDKTMGSANRIEAKKQLKRVIDAVRTQLNARNQEKSGNINESAVDVQGVQPLLVDYELRKPYKRFAQTTGALNQILIRGTDDQVRDMADCSLVVAAIEDFELFRAYVDESDQGAKQAIETIIANELQRERHDRQTGSSDSG